MRGSLLLTLLLGAAFAPTLASAHFLWASLDPATKTVAVALQEVPTDAPLPFGDRAAKIKAWTATEKSLSLQANDNWLKSGTAAPCVGVSLDYGVLDRRDQNRGVFWLQYYAKASASPEASQAQVGLPVDVTLKMVDGKPVVTVLKDGKAAPSAEVTLEEEFIGKTGTDGTLEIPVASGNFAIRAMVADPTKGSHNGQDYDLVRSYCTLTVAMPVASAPVKVKTLSEKLADSFGGNHSTVQESAFNQTLMSGHLTKAQWEAHLIQRAIVQEEIDRILRAANLPAYGEEQKDLMPLLRHDIEAMGSKWPDESVAWASTKAFLKQIRESEKQGPYFALGVWHIYYGGTTHGGRQIGAIAAKALGVDPTYYYKSGGYREYVVKVNEITDPGAEKGMTDGGLAAYKYVIDSSNADIFKSN